MTQFETPECESGYPEYQVERILEAAGRSVEEFNSWMRGQTMTLCDGRRFDHNERAYYESCGGRAHGGVVYAWDLDRFLRRKPIID